MFLKGSRMTRTGEVTAALTLCLLLGFAVPLFAQQPPPPINLTLNDAIRLAFQRNLDVKVELYNPAMGEADIRRSQGIYDPLVSAGVSYERTNSPNTITFTPFVIDQFIANAGITQLLPTGGTVGAQTNSSWVSNSTSYASSDLRLTISQPLLRNFGRYNTELNIAVAKANKEGSLDRFRAKLSDTVAQVRSDYFKLYNLREDLAVKRTSLALANRILEETKGRVKAGVLPAMEILSAEFGSAQREKAVIDAERAVRDQADVLRQSLQLDPSREIVIVDQPYKESYPVVEEEALAQALLSRPELAAQRMIIKANDLQRRAARNKTLPDLTVNATVGSAGIASTYVRSLGKTVAVEDPVWGIGLQFSYPIGNRTAENEYIRSKLTLEQSQTLLQSQESSVVTEVKAAIRLLASSYKQIEVTTRGRAYAEERLRAFRKKNEVGLATTKDVFDVENDLVTAEGNQIQAVVDYNNAITQLWRVTGSILERQHISVTDSAADPLYEAAKN
jgi:outer membrane protein